MTWQRSSRNYGKLPITWLKAFQAAAAITWRSLAANICIVLTAIALSLALGLEIGVHPGGITNLAFEWTRPFGAYVGVAQTAATVWAVKRAVEISLRTSSRPLTPLEALSATWSFAWRHFIAVFGVASLLYIPFRISPDGPLEWLKAPALAVLAVWTFGPSFVWAVRGMLRTQIQLPGGS